MNHVQVGPELAQKPNGIQPAKSITGQKPQIATLSPRQTEIAVRNEVEPNDVTETCMDSSTPTRYNCAPNTETEFEKPQFGVPTTCPQPDRPQGLDPFGCVDWTDTGDQGKPITIEMDRIEDCNDEFYQH